MLEDGPLLAPSCYRLPPTIDPVGVHRWTLHLHVHLIVEIFTLSMTSVLYEMAQYCQQRPRHRRSAVADGGGLDALMESLAEPLRRFDPNTLLFESRCLFNNHFEAGQRCVRFHPALERLLPPTTETRDTLIADSCAADEPAARCVAQAVDRDRWVFRDEPRRLGSSPLDGEPNHGRCLVLGGDAKLAYSVALFLWAAVRLLARRIELLLQFPREHAVFAPRDKVLKVSTFGNSFETLVYQREEQMSEGNVLYRGRQWRAAAEAYTQALAVSPEWDDGKYYLHRIRACCHFHLGELAAVVADCTAALTFNPTGYLPLTLRARALEAMGQAEAAAADLAQLQHLYPDNTQGGELPAQLAVDFPEGSIPTDCPVADVQGSPSSGYLSSAPASPTEPSPTPSPEASPRPAVRGPDGSSSVGAALALDLSALPVYPEPLPPPEPPHLAALMDTAGVLDYTLCPQELGRGAFGRVYKAVHPSGRFLAVKDVEAGEVEGCEDLLRALDLTTTMKHPHIVRCLEMRRLPGRYHILLELCSGGTLRSLINDLGMLPLPLMQKYATQILLGLRYMHGHGLLHRDIKASNILLQSDGVAKIGDLGSCMKIPEDGQARCEAVKGTVLWMAPEAFRGRYSAASDVWSFGCVLVEMATAKDPWHEQRFREQMVAMVFIATRPDAVPALPPTLGDDLGGHFFRCCIARDPSERMSADLLLRHPWLRGLEPGPPTCG